jgi:hypothetical protein
MRKWVSYPAFAVALLYARLASAQVIGGTGGGFAGGGAGAGLVAPLWQWAVTSVGGFLMLAAVVYIGIRCINGAHWGLFVGTIIGMVILAYAGTISGLVPVGN